MTKMTVFENREVYAQRGSHLGNPAHLSTLLTEMQKQAARDGGFGRLRTVLKGGP